MHSEDARFSRQQRQVILLVQYCLGTWNCTWTEVQSVRVPAGQYHSTLTAHLPRGYPSPQGHLPQQSPAADAGMHERGQGYKNDLLLAIYLIDDACWQRTVSTNANCFGQAGFSSRIQISNMQGLSECYSEADAVCIKEIPLDFEKYVHINIDVASCLDNTVESIVSDV